MIKKLIFIAFIIFCLALFLGLTDPESLPIGLLFVPVILLFFLLTTLSNLIITFLRPKIPQTQLKTLSVMLGFIFSISFLFYSSSGVVLGDVILVFLILVIGFLYINKY